VGQGIMAVYGADVTVALTGQSITVQQGLMTVAVAASASKSGVSRQWLIDYYTEAFAKKDKLPDEQAIAKLKTAAARKKAIRIAEIVQEEAIEKLVAKAESDLQVLTQGIKDSQAAQEFTYNLISQAKKHIASEVDFIAVAEQYQNRIRQEDDELLLLSMIL
jgi:type II secretory ATPase GspE/PulE/Tfp pilus assembly ATPase PilB-like protein